MKCVVDSQTLRGEIMDTIQEQNEAMLKKWDSGERIDTVELGGMGDGYEYGIQLATVEIVRYYIGFELPEDIKAFLFTYGDGAIMRVDKILPENGGLSGAQLGAAKWLAYRWLAEGYEANIIRARSEIPDRIINVKNRDV